VRHSHTELIVRDPVVQFSTTLHKQSTQGWRSTSAQGLICIRVKVDRYPVLHTRRYLRGFRAHWVSAHSNLERLLLDSIESSVLKRALELR